jgi:hypothetical protein
LLEDDDETDALAHAILSESIKVVEIIQYATEFLVE